MDKAKIWTEDVNIPTYELGEYSKLPVFLEKRVYQGSSGKVYPYPVCDSVSDEKRDKTYTAVFMENEYLLIMVLPEISGKIQRILDKTNNCDAVYYNEVIKPALAGLAGPWVSGGVEISWPQHHRPSAADCVDYTIKENPDGSVSVIVSEIEKMFGTKGMASYTLYPKKAYLEIKGQLYNQTDRPQTFMWWANPSVYANEYTRSVFPPDVQIVTDLGRRDITRFPISTGTYYKADYSEGVDISKFKNIPVPTSCAAYHSDYDFIGSYDEQKKTGLLHIADHHIAPGKKQWTWGSGDFGRAWYKNLTDENGPYVELMAGVFSDNQPGFTFIAPYEEKTFTQYFLPYKAVGSVKNASIRAIINLEVRNGRAFASVYVPEETEVIISLTGRIEKYISEKITLSPETPYTADVLVNGDEETDLTLSVKDPDGNTIIAYTPAPQIYEKTPEPAKACPPPRDIASTEELYLTALHLEQNRHASYSPEDYYLEGLRRDKTDIRLNNAYGRYLYNKGLFEKAEIHFKEAIKKLTMKNPNPYDCEPYYNFGLALRRQGRYDEAFDAFYKAIWSGAMQDKGYYQLACISAKRGNYAEALEFIEKSLIRGAHNIKARNLKTTLLRLIGKLADAKRLAEETMLIDPLNYGSRYELFRVTDDFTILNELTIIMRGEVDAYIELSLDYNEFGLYDEAAKVLALVSSEGKPMLHYYMAYYSKSDIELNIAAECSTDYCFPSRLTDMLVLKYAIEHNENDSNAPYLLGNLFYDKGLWQEAFRCWTRANELNYDNPIVHRNLSLVYFNKLRDERKAVTEMERAFRLDKENVWILYELDQLYKQTNVTIKKRLKLLSDNLELVQQRDDLYTEYVTLLNSNGMAQEALKAIEIHSFHPREGGEGKIAKQYKTALISLAGGCITAGDYDTANEYLQSALIYPDNLGEGKLLGTFDNDVYYMLGRANEKTDYIAAEKYFQLARRGGYELSEALYYNDQPPEMFYYRALAARALGDEKTARGKFNLLVTYGLEHYDDNIDIDYFAASLPDFLIFNTDLRKKNRAECCYLTALGYFGLGEMRLAKEYTEKGHNEDVSHQGLIGLLNYLEESELA